MLKKSITLTMLLCLVLTFSGCQEANKQVDLKVAYLSGPTALTVLQLAHDKPSIADNVSVTYEMVPATDVMMGKLTAEEVDISIIATNQAAMLYNKGIEYQIAAPSVWGVLYMLGVNDLTDINELVGQEIALIGKGLTPDIMLRHILTQNGIDPENDVTLTYLSGPQELLQSLIMNRYQYAVVPQPLASVAQVKNTDLKVVLDFQQEWQNLTGQDSYPQSSLVVRKAFAEENPEVVASFLELYRSSIDWANENPAQLGAYAEEMEIGLTAGIVKKALPTCNLRFTRTEEVRTEIETYLEALHEIMPDAVGGQVPDSDFYYNGN